MQCSIIIPVFNVEKYLDQCLESVLNQSYADFECILVNDGSTDNSGYICDKWARKDNRFKVFHQDNQGVSCARNNGIDNANGEYIVFIDSDDWVDKNYLELLMNNDSDYVVSGVVVESNEIVLSQSIPLQNIEFDLTLDKIIDITQLLKKHLLFGPVFKRYKTSIIKSNKLYFNESFSFGEDLLFNFEYLKHVTKIRTISQVTYHYRRFESTTLSTKFEPNYWDINYSQWLIMKAFFLDNGLFVSPLSDVMYQRLWGIIYDSIFILNKLQLGFIQSYKYTRNILSIPEIKIVEFDKCQFDSSKWIKFLIKNRLSLLFTLICKLKR